MCEEEIEAAMTKENVGFEFGFKWQFHDHFLILNVDLFISIFINPTLGVD